jgi:hypothetical protein
MAPLLYMPETSSRTTPTGLTYVPKKPKRGEVVKPDAPKFSKMTYYSATIVAYDSNNALCTLEPNFAHSTYEVKSTVPDVKHLDMTANDVGVVVKRDDGWLYQRFVETDSKDEDGTFAVLIDPINMDPIFYAELSFAAGTLMATMFFLVRYPSLWLILSSWASVLPRLRPSSKVFSTV